MEVAVVFYDLPPEGGGGHTFQQSLLAGLRRMRPTSAHRFHLYVAGEAAGAPDLIRIPFNRGPRRWPDLARRTFRDLQECLNIHSSRPASWFQRSLAERGVQLVWFASHYLEECDVPFVCTVWDLAHLESPWFPEVGADGEWQRRSRKFNRFLPRATAVVVPNRAGTQTLVRNFPMLEGRVLELEFPTPEFALSAASEHVHPEAEQAVLDRYGVRRPYLFYPAQFWAHKNHANALEVLRILNERGDPRFQLVCVGSDKGQLQYVRQRARELGVAESTLILGFVPSSDLVALYRNAYALLFLSFFGPANLPPLEAFALGCPVVCADVPGMHHQLGDAALFAPPTEPDAIATQLLKLSDEKCRQGLIAAGASRARRHSPDAYVSAVLDFIDGFDRVRRCWP
jgi:glycosyltransferase involved in cell wall biosynthesis